MAPAWKEYQETAAAQFRALGLTAETDQRLVGARGQHDIDVAVRGNRAGMEFLWVVECQRWKTNVPKSAVATLSTIVQDLGADRGIILSEKGFQSGAIRLAQGSNVTLTSLAVMRDKTYREWVEYQCAELAGRFKAVREKVSSRTTPPARPPGGAPSAPKCRHGRTCRWSRYRMHPVQQLAQTVDRRFSAQVMVMEGQVTMTVGGVDVTFTPEPLE